MEDSLETGISDSPSAVEYLNPTSQFGKDDTVSVEEEGEPDESLHIGTDLLAERLDYEVEDDVDETEEVLTVDKNSPVNPNDNIPTDPDSPNFDNDPDKNGDTLDAASDRLGISETLTVRDIDQTTYKDDAGSQVYDSFKDASTLNVGTDYVKNVDVIQDENSSLLRNLEFIEKDNDRDVKTDDTNKSTNAVSNEELEEGEVSDEDEEARKERLKPQPVCRFYSKGACTWGSSCRFIHPGVMDTGR